MSANYEANRMVPLAGRPDTNMFRYSLTQRVYLTFADYYPQALDRAHVMLVLNLGDRALDHAMRRLTNEGCVLPTPGRRGFYEFVPGSLMPVDTRGMNPGSRGNRGARANDEALALLI